MHTRNTPTIDARYWTVISLASIFGANLGDFASRILHLGHWRGLAPFALILLIVLLLERRSKQASEAYYWLAIIIVRTAATNLADLATHDFKLGYGAVVAGLAALLICVLPLLDSRNNVALNDSQPGLPVANDRYWVAMLIAGTLGTAAGDAMAGPLGMGVGWASVVLGGVLAVVFGLRTRPQFVTQAFYWVTIVIVRTAGTTVGDFIARSIGLVPSTGFTGLLFVGTLLLWRSPPEPVLRQA